MSNTRRSSFLRVAVTRRELANFQYQRKAPASDVPLCENAHRRVGCRKKFEELILPAKITMNPVQAVQVFATFFASDLHVTIQQTTSVADGLHASRKCEQAE